MIDKALERFLTLIRQGEDLDLAEGALLIAQAEYPDLDIGRYLARLDRMAEEVRCGRGSQGPSGPLDRLNVFLFEEQGFCGNTEGYYDPRNSFLNDVLDRRTGIPITLSVVYMELGRRLGLTIQGIGLPGHFVVQYQGDTETSFIDTFNRGAVLDTSDCEALVARATGRSIELQPEHFRPVGKRQILARMLLNLKGIWFSRKEWGRALAMVERLLLIDPAALGEVRDRGIVHARLGAWAEAARDIEAYLRARPDAPDAETVRHHLRAVRQALASRN